MKSAMDPEGGGLEELAVMTTTGTKGLVAGRGRSDEKDVGDTEKLSRRKSGQRDLGTEITGLAISEVCVDTLPLPQCLVESRTWTAFIRLSVHSLTQAIITNLGHSGTTVCRALGQMLGILRCGRQIIGSLPSQSLQWSTLYWCYQQSTGALPTLLQHGAGCWVWGSGLGLCLCHRPDN